MAMNLVTIDPAKRRMGYAVWLKGRLVLADTLRTPIVRRLAPKVVNAVDLALAGHGPALWVVEYPRTYPGQTGRDRDLETLRKQAESLRYEAGCIGLVNNWNRIYPADWKGQVPKHVIETRCREALVPGELRAVRSPESDDTWDAIGIGLVLLRRLGRGCVAP